MVWSLAYRTFLNSTKVRGADGGPLVIYAGHPFTIEVFGDTLRSVDRIRIVDPNITCGEGDHNEGSGISTVWLTGPMARDPHYEEPFPGSTGDLGYTFQYRDLVLHYVFSNFHSNVWLIFGKL